MECPNPECSGDLILTRVISQVLGLTGEVPEADIRDAEDYILCTDCFDMPSYTWEGSRIVLVRESDGD